jgi:SNF2 family DNA or RNA helicase
VTKLASRMKFAWGMTGRPIPRAPTDVWAQARILTPQNVPKFFGRYREELMIRHPHSQFQWLPKHDAADRAFAALQPAVRYSIDDVAELPELIERDVQVGMGVKQLRIYKQLAKDCYAKLQSQEITAANAGVVMNKLLQVAAGWVYAKDKSVVTLDNELRLEAMLDAIDSTNRKALVFVPFKHALAGISGVLTQEKIEHASVSGDTAPSERDRIFSAFQQTSKYKVLAAHPQCLAHGITLTAADTIIWFGPTTSLEIYEQANARIRRVGQKHKQQVLKFTGTPIEKRIYKILSDHQVIQDRLLDLFEAASE